MRKLFIALFLCISVTIGYSQDDLSSKLQKVGQLYGEKYLEPFTKSFGSNLNSGWLGGLKIASYSKLPVTLSLYGGVKFTGLVLSEEDQFFNLTYTDNYKDPNTGITYNNASIRVNNAPTVFGPTTPAVAQIYDNNNNYIGQTNLIGGVANTKFVPLFIPQIGFGSILGTDATVRYMPRVSLGNYGNIMFTGFAIRHNIANYIKGMPFDLAVQGGWQKFSVKDDNELEIINATAYMFNIQAAKTIFLVTLYGGIQYENFSIDVNYVYRASYVPSPVVVTFSQKGVDNFRGILGASLNLPGFTVNADLNMARNFMISVGMGASF